MVESIGGMGNPAQVKNKLLRMAVFVPAKAAYLAGKVVTVVPMFLKDIGKVNGGEIFKVIPILGAVFACINLFASVVEGRSNIQDLKVVDRKFRIIPAALLLVSFGDVTTAAKSIITCIQSKLAGTAATAASTAGTVLGGIGLGIQAVAITIHSIGLVSFFKQHKAFEKDAEGYVNNALKSKRSERVFAVFNPGQLKQIKNAFTEVSQNPDKVKAVKSIVNRHFSHSKKLKALAVAISIIIFVGVLLISFTPTPFAAAGWAILGVGVLLAIGRLVAVLKMNARLNRDLKAYAMPKFTFSIEVEGNRMNINTNNQQVTKEKSLELLKAITDNYNKKVKEMRIVAENNPALDEGGPKRELFAKIVQNVLEVEPLSNLFENKTSGYVLSKTPETDDEKECLKNLGEMLGICAKFDVQIGSVFTRETFDVLTQMNRRSEENKGSIDLNKDNEFNRFFEFYKSIESESEEGRKYIENLEAGLKSEDEEVKELAKETAIKGIDSKVRPLLSLLGGINNTIDASLKQLPLGDLILGLPLDGEGLLNQIQFNDGVPDQAQEWINNWIKERTKEEVESFLYALTGSPTLKPNVKINFTQTEHLKYAGHENAYELNTCYRILWLDYAQVESEEQMHSILVSVLGGSGFNVK